MTKRKISEIFLSLLHADNKKENVDKIGCAEKAYSTGDDYAAAPENGYVVTFNVVTPQRTAVYGKKLVHMVDYEKVLMM